MSKESTPELTKSWVLVEPNQSGIQEVTENELHGDSDTDSISVISESGCSCRTDEEENISIKDPQIETVEEIRRETEPEEIKPLETCRALEPKPVEIPRKGEKLVYFVKSAICAVILIGISIVVQCYQTSNSNFEPNQEAIFSQLKSPKEDVIKGNPSSKFAVPKIARLQEDALNDKVKKNFDLKSKYKKNDNENHLINHDDIIIDDPNDKIKTSDDNVFDKKIKELKIKEEYLKEKEKFLIEKEHALLKKEISLNKEKYTKNTHDKKKEYENSSEEDYDEKNDKHKRKNKKAKYGCDKKKTSEKRSKCLNEQAKQRTISGQWYINLHEARDNMRQKKYAYFKRNKAHWYFQWMVDRARLRGK